jgi:hypothetical protein
MGLPEAARDPAYPSMLRRLKLNWGANLQRQSQRRRHQDGREFEVSFGLKSVHQLIAPPSRGDTIHYGLSGNEPAPDHRALQDRQRQHGRTFPEPQRRPGHADPRRRRGGRAPGRRRLERIGLVRWFRVPGQGEICFGVQLLAPKVLAVQVRRPDNGRQWPGLLLHPNPTSQQAPMLLAQPGCFIPDSNAEIRTPKGNQPVRIEKRVESTPAWSCSASRWKPPPRGDRARAR